MQAAMLVCAAMLVAHVILVSPQALRLGFGLLDFGLGLDNRYFLIAAHLTPLCVQSELIADVPPPPRTGRPAPGPQSPCWS